MPELVRIAATGSEPVTLDELKLWLRLEADDDVEDALLTSLITAGRESAEKFCNKSFLLGEQWQLTLDSFPLAELDGEVGAYGAYLLSERYGDLASWTTARNTLHGIELREGPVTAVSSVTYVDSNGVNQTLPGGNYRLLVDGEGDARLYPVYPNGWPSTQASVGAVVVTYTAGGAPETVKIAIKAIAGNMYNSRNQATIPDIAERLLRPFKSYVV